MTRVLVVDDEAPILRALRINLTAREYQVSTASDGTSGLAAMARDRPDVLILDLGLQPLANNLLRPEDLSKPEPDCGCCTDS